MTSLLSLFDATLRGRATLPAMEFAGVTHAFAEVDERARRMAVALRARGIGAGDRVVVHLTNSLEFIDLFLACLRTGVIMVPANVLYRGRELAHIVADAAPQMIVTSDEHLGLFPPGAPAVSIKALTALTSLTSLTSLTALVAAEPADHRHGALTDDSPALIIYTSGTTGRAKGAVLTHANLAANAKHLVEAWQITAGDRYLGTLPLFHVHGLGNGLCTWLMSGCLMRLEERFDHASAARWFEEFAPTLFFGVPTMYVRMLEWPQETAARIGERMRLFVCGSAPLPAHLLEAFRMRYGHTILERYGMSETLMNIGNPYDGVRRAGSVGVPFERVEARIVDVAGAAVPAETVGQLEVRGPNVFREYWRNAEATQNAFRDGWFRTGDIAERSADGYYTLRGRGTDLIISGGFNIYPREIEELLLEQPGVREVAVVGAADPVRGEVPIAYVVLAPGSDAAVLRETCTRSLASFKVPRVFILMDALPRTALGKVQKHLLPPWSPQ